MNQAPSTIGALQAAGAFGLSYRLREPQPTAPKHCVVLLHGVGGNETNLADFAAEISADTLVLFVQGPLSLGANQFAWFKVAFTPNGPSIDAAQAEQSRLALLHFISQVQRIYEIEPKHTVVAGFSQGGILSASVALSSPESVAGFGLLSGRILPELEPQLADRARLSHLQAFVAHGEYDSTLPIVWARRADALLNELGVAHQLHLYPIDHGISAEMHDDFIDWLMGLE